MSETIRITEAEWEVMLVCWEHVPVAASAIVKAMEKKKSWSLATVRTLLQRLVNKGALTQAQDGKRYLYTPAISMQACVHQESKSFLDRVLGKMPATTVMNLVEQTDLTKSEINELRRILRLKEK